MAGSVANPPDAAGVPQRADGAEAAAGGRAEAAAGGRAEAAAGGRAEAAVGEPLVLVIPDPALVVLVGAAGAGKSTLAARWFHPDEILSSDALRAAISGDPADQTVSAAAFARLHRRLAQRALAGRTTVVDATNVTRAGRAPLLRRAAGAGMPAVAVVLDLPPDVVHARNAGRPGRVVPATVVDRQLRDLGRALAAPGGFVAEGFHGVHLVRGVAALDALRIERQGDSGPQLQRGTD